jgi:phage shock protein B
MTVGMHYSVFLIPAIIIGGILLAVLIPTLLALGAVRLLGGGRSRSKVTQDDMRVVQEVYSNLSAMEKRIEALETILLDRTRKG